MAMGCCCGIEDVPFCCDADACEEEEEVEGETPEPAWCVTKCSCPVTEEGTSKENASAISPSAVAGVIVSGMEKPGLEGGEELPPEDALEKKGAIRS